MKKHFLTVVYAIDDKPETVEAILAQRPWQAVANTDALAYLEHAQADLQAATDGYNAARLEIESLQTRLIHANEQHRLCFARSQELDAQLNAVGAGGVEPLRKRDHFRDATEMVDDDDAVMSMSLRQCADAWGRVCALLHELRPGWLDTSTGTAAQHALDAIRSMGAPK